MLGKAMDSGEAPADFELMGGIVQDVCHRNAADYFRIPRKAATG
jgi:glucuronate isomerase